MAAGKRRRSRHKMAQPAYQTTCARRKLWEGPAGGHPPEGNEAPQGSLVVRGGGEAIRVPAAARQQNPTWGDVVLMLGARPDGVRRVNPQVLGVRRRRAGAWWVVSPRDQGEGESFYVSGAGGDDDKDRHRAFGASRSQQVGSVRICICGHSVSFLNCRGLRRCHDGSVQCPSGPVQETQPAYSVAADRKA